ncbi:hypothetical protein QW131_08910 [Roseibium salinum]|nr:hypothetical protein [Roseibium salinum]
MARCVKWPRRRAKSSRREKVRTVGHLEGGIVAEVLVREGELVEEGAPLIRLQETAASSDLEKVRTRLEYLSGEEQRFQAATSDSNGLRLGVRTGFSEAQQAALDAQQEALAQELEAMRARISEKQAELESIVERVAFQKNADRDRARKSLKFRSLSSNRATPPNAGIWRPDRRCRKRKAS